METHRIDVIKPLIEEKKISQFNFGSIQNTGFLFLQTLT